MNQEFNDWWNGDVLSGHNPFGKDTPAFWAWEGWVAGVKAERDACAKLAEEPYEFTSNEANRIASAIRARNEK
jgi:hypothetical protein